MNLVREYKFPEDPDLEVRVSRFEPCDDPECECARHGGEVAYLFWAGYGPSWLYLHSLVVPADEADDDTVLPEETHLMDAHGETERAADYMRKVVAFLGVPWAVVETLPDVTSAMQRDLLENMPEQVEEWLDSTPLAQIRVEAERVVQLIEEMDAGEAGDA